jgi:hypothetical protein
MSTDDHGCWVLVAPRSRLPQLDPLVELRSADRPVRVIARDDPPAADEWARLVPGGASGVLLVGDRRRSPARVTDRPFVRAADGSWVPAGWLPAARDLSTYVEAATAVAGRRDRSPVAVLGQRSPRYQQLSERLVHHLGDLPSVRWGAERITREDLVAGLGLGLGLAVYLGHGRPTGWAAYRGLRAAHLGLSEPLGALLSLTCWTASRWRVGTSFSEQAVLQGAAAAAVGAVRPVLHLDNTRVVVALAAALRGPTPDVGSLLRAMLLVGGDPTPEAASYRLVGDPLASLAGADDVLARASAVFAPAPDHPTTPLEAVR